MESTRVVKRLSRMGVTAFIFVGASLVLNPIGLPLAAAATKIPLCQTSQLTISTGTPTVHRKTGESVHLYFTNTGRTCDLFNTEPGVQAVNGKRHAPVGSGTTNDLMLRPVVTLTKGQHSRSTPFVGTMNGSLATRCAPVTTDGIVVGDGLPYNSSRYVQLVLHGVCSSPSVDNLADSYYSRATG